MREFIEGETKLEKYEVMCSCGSCDRTWLIKVTDDDLKRLQSDMLIQDALPHHTPYEREILRYRFRGLPMIACCGECYEENWF